MGRNVVPLLLVAGLAGCAGGHAGGVNIGVTLYPINAAANKYGVLRTTYTDYGNLSASVTLDTGRETFDGQAVTVDSGYSGWGSIVAHGSAVAVSGGGYAAAYAASGATSRTAVMPNALRGVANGYSPSGKRLQCEYVVNNSALTTTGICQISDGALFRFYSKPI